MDSFIFTKSSGYLYDSQQKLNNYSYWSPKLINIFLSRHVVELLTLHSLYWGYNLHYPLSDFYLYTNCPTNNP